MSLIQKNYVSCGILAIGFLFFCWYINSFEFIAASITMLSSLLLWIAFNIHFDMFNKAVFAKVLCYSGLILSIAILFIFGIEEVPFPEGALLFHGYGIALSLLGVLLSIIPILFITDIQIITDSPNNQSSQFSNSSSSRNIKNEIDDDWEIATQEDVEGGDFEVAA